MRTKYIVIILLLAVLIVVPSFFMIKEMPMVYLFIVGILGITLTGCAVGMALSGKKEPQVDDLRKGMDIEEAHFIMRDYTPVVSIGEDGTRVEVYTVQLGNAPSGGKALGHAAMDVMTFGLWEIVGTPIEAFSSGKYTIS